MKLAMIGVDFHTAAIDMREEISLSETNIKEVLSNMNENNVADGAVIISTCNRTEIYFSSYDYLDSGRLISIFSKATQIAQPAIDKSCYIKRADELIHYLFELACGLHSMILGEDQIITQVYEAIELSMNEKASNSILNTLFRFAVTCAKRAKSDVNINYISPSIVSGAIDMAEDYLIRNRKSKVLVIGNGEIGRLAAKSFINKGCDVCMTQRKYKHTDVIVPDGCKTVPYENREEMIPEVDILVSSTKSPHYTITYEMISQHSRKPDYIFDLALPRDIDPAVKEINSIKYFDVDDIGKHTSYYDQEKLSEIREIIAKHYRKFNRWYLTHNKIQKEVIAK